jgi:5-dehydro-4-deoxyglucarate dehydratase
MFNFVPDFAISFYNNVMAEKTEAVLSDIRSFIRPFVAMRDREAGYAVSIIKAGLDAVGRYGGPVRPPLAALTDAERTDLYELVLKAR